MSIYTVDECEKRIKAIDAKMAELEDLPQRQGVGPFQIGLAGKMSDLRKERDHWRKRLRRARRDESAGNSMQTGSTIS